MSKSYHKLIKHEDDGHNKSADLLTVYDKTIVWTTQAEGSITGNDQVIRGLSSEQARTMARALVEAADAADKK